MRAQILTLFCLIACPLAWSQTVDLSGEWHLGGTIVVITQEGDHISARFESLGTNPYGVKAGDTAFTGTLVGREVNGEVTVRAREEHAPALAKQGTIRLVLGQRNQWLRGRYQVFQYDIEEKTWTGGEDTSFVSLRREPCREERAQLEELKRKLADAASDLDPLDTEIELRRIQLRLLVEDREKARLAAAGIGRDAGPTLEDTHMRGEAVDESWQRYQQQRAAVNARHDRAWQRYRAGEISVGEYQGIRDETAGELRRLAEGYTQDVSSMDGAEGVEEIRSRARTRRSREIEQIESRIERVVGERDDAIARKNAVLERIEQLQAEIDALEARYRECLEREADADCADWEKRFHAAAEAYAREWERYQEDKRKLAEKVNAWTDEMITRLSGVSTWGDLYAGRFGGVLDFRKMVDMTTDGMEKFLSHVDTVDQAAAVISLAQLGKSLALRGGNKLAAGKLDDMIDATYARFANKLPRTAEALSRMRAANSSVTSAYRQARMWAKGDAARWDVTADALQATMARMSREGLEDLAVIPSGSSAQVAEYMATRNRSILSRAAADADNPYRGVTSDIDVQFVYKRPDFSKLSGRELTEALERDRVVRDRISRAFNEEFKRLSGGISAEAADVAVFANPGLTRGTAGSSSSQAAAHLDTLFNRANKDAYTSRGSLWMQMMMDKTSARAFRHGEAGWKAVDETSQVYGNFFKHLDVPTPTDAYGGFLENVLNASHYADDVVRGGTDAMKSASKMSKYYMRSEYHRFMADPRIRSVIEGEGQWAARLRDMDPHDFVAAFAQSHPELVGSAAAARIASARRLKAGENVFSSSDEARQFAEDTLRHMKGESAGLGRASDSYLSGLDDAALAEHMRSTNDMMLTQYSPDELRRLGLSEDLIRRVTRLGRSLDEGSPVYRRILARMRDQAGEFRSPIGSLPYEVVRAIGGIGKLLDLPPPEELPSIEWWLLGKAWEGISSPFKSVAELTRFFFAEMGRALHGEQLLQMVRDLSDPVKRMNSSTSEVAAHCNTFQREGHHDPGDLWKAMRELESDERAEHQLLDDIEDHLRQHGPDACLIRLKDSIKKWIDETGEVRAKEKSVLRAIDETLGNMERSGELLWESAVTTSSTNGGFISEVMPERILEPLCLYNVQRGSEYFRQWKQVFEAQRAAISDTLEVR